MGNLNFFKKYLYRERLSGVEDMDLWVRSNQGNNFFILNNPLLFYRDPLVFKLSTYHYRRTQSNLRIKIEWKEGYFSFFYYIKMRVLSCLKYYMATLYSFWGIDYKLIKRRNDVCPRQEKLLFEEILRIYIRK